MPGQSLDLDSHVRNRELRAALIERERFQRDIVSPEAHAVALAAAVEGYVRADRRVLEAMKALRWATRST